MRGIVAAERPDEGRGYMRPAWVSRSHGPGWLAVVVGIESVTVGGAGGEVDLRLARARISM